MTTANPKKILFVAPVGEKGGGEVVLLDIARGLDRTRWTPIVACLKPGPFVEELRDAGIATFALPAHKSREFHKVGAAIASLAQIIRREKIDLIHGNGGTMLLYGGGAAKLTGKPCVWSVYDPIETWTLFERAFVAAQRLLTPIWTIFGTPAAPQSFRDAYKRIADRWSLILPGVDVAALTDGADAQRARQNLGIPADAPLVSMFARLQRNKGHLTLVAAAASVVRRFPETRFALCGGSLFGMEPDYPGEVNAAIAAQGLTERVFLTGYVSESQKKDILAASQIVAHPALSEPFGIAVIEGMAFGKPIVATDCVGPKTTVKDGETGFLTPRGDEGALANALMTLLGDPQKAAALGQQGRQRVLTQYATQAMVCQIEEIYTRVLDKRV